ncbi:hypothetical protein JXA47_12355 [Candidatus Sumerlaeota bacterium]|nr:hypothetical protein [Candidatus Sumerlaeota bacterium]
MIQRLIMCAALAVLVVGGLSAQTVIDNFESYPGSTELGTAWPHNGSWANRYLVTTGGAEDNLQYMQIDDAGYSLNVTHDAGLIVPADGYYRVTAYYTNGRTGVTQYGLEFKVAYGTSGLETIDLNTANSETPVSTWTAIETDLMELTTSDAISIQITGTAGARSGQISEFDQIILVGPITPALEVSLTNDPREYLSGTVTLTAEALGGTAPYTQVEFDINDDGSVEHTDNTPGDGFTYDWDSSAIGTQDVATVTIGLTVTDSVPDTASSADDYPVDNRFNGRTQLVTNGGFETWSAHPSAEFVDGVPDNWVVFENAIGANGEDPAGYNVTNMTLYRVAASASPENVADGNYALGIEFINSDTVQRYALRTENLFPGTGVASFLDCIISYWGKGGSNRIYLFRSEDGGATYEWDTPVANAASTVLNHAFSAPFILTSDNFVLSTHMFNGGNEPHIWDEVSMTGNQFLQTAVDEGVWNLYH